MDGNDLGEAFSILEDALQMWEVIFEKLKNNEEI